jgi:uncharacterized protein YndB with AHSA1/START domain
MTVVDVETLITAPPQAVWDVVMNPKRLSEWVTIHRGVRDVSPGAPREGFEMSQGLSLRGITFHVRWELAECHPPRRALWEGRGPARSTAHIEYLLEPEDGGTRFHYRNEFTAPLGPLGAAASRALVGGISIREAQRSLALLKALVERGHE